MKKLFIICLLFLSSVCLFSISIWDLRSGAWVASREVPLDLSGIEVPPDVVIKGYVYYEILFFKTTCVIKITEVVVVNSAIANQQTETIESEFSLVKDDVIVIDDLMLFAEDDTLVFYIEDDNKLVFIKRPKISEFKESGDV